MTEELPGSWKQAVNVHPWKGAMEREIIELKYKRALTLVNKVADMNVLPGVWNYRAKRDENGEIVKYKARWCVKWGGGGLKRIHVVTRSYLLDYCRTIHGTAHIRSRGRRRPSSPTN